MFKRAYRLVLLPLVAAMLFAAPARAATDQEELVSDALRTVDMLVQSHDTGPYVRNYLQQAKAVLILPAMLKGAFFVGAEGGTGVLLARGNGGWSYPAFYVVGSGSFGLQLGGQASQMMLIIMTDKALTAVLDGKVKLGADLSAAMGPVGVGAEAATTINMGADIYSYSLAKGAYLGASVEGAVVYHREQWNFAYYDPSATPRGIVLDGRYANPQADPLRNRLSEIR